MLKTKIIASYGPACDNEVILKKMYEYGMRVVRINTSFTTIKELDEAIFFIRKSVPKVALLLDVQGYKIRIKHLSKSLTVKKGDRIFVAAKESCSVKNTLCTIAIDYPQLFSSVKVGSILHIDEGKVIIRVVEILDKGCLCEVLEGGEIASKKTINAPGINLNFPNLSTKDKQIITLAAREKIEFIALSFVRSIKDVEEGRKLLGKSDTKIIAKIENSQGVKNFDEILKVSDGIMVARGDLGVETLLEKVPLLQKEFVRKANTYGKPIIIATHMLESMIHQVVPTRAEVSDVANAILDGADSVMLSGETAVGKYPIKAVKEMAKIAFQVEKSMEFTKCERNIFEIHKVGKPMTNGIAHAIMQICNELPIKSILVATSSGTTARAIASFKPKQDIFAFTSKAISAYQLNLSFGVVSSVFFEKVKGRDNSIKTMIKNAKKEVLIKKGEMILLVSGANIMHQGTTNMLEILEIK